MTGASIRRKTWMPAVFSGLAAFVNLGLNLVLIPLFGPMGAAASTLIAYIVLALVAYLANQRIYPIPYEIGRFLLALLSGVILYVVADGLAPSWGDFWHWLVTLGSLLLYGGVCLLFLGRETRPLLVRGANLFSRVSSGLPR